jgi:hypothetical protein
LIRFKMIPLRAFVPPRQIPPYLKN